MQSCHMYQLAGMQSCHMYQLAGMQSFHMYVCIVCCMYCSEACKVWTDVCYTPAADDKWVLTVVQYQLVRAVNVIQGCNKSGG